MSQITIKDLQFTYSHGKEILSDINIAIQRGENVGLVGANGVGKSTLLKLLIGLQLCDKECIWVDDVPLKKDTLQEIRKKIGYVFQDSDSQLFMSTVYEDVAFAPKNYGYSEEEVKLRSMEALKMVHMEDLKDKHVYTLSGGEKKLAALATILSTNPDVILLDEPSVALDPQNRRNLIYILNQLDAMKVIASHDLDFIYDTCERTILLSHGHVIADGKTTDILTNQKLLEEHGLELPLSMIKRK